MKYGLGIKIFISFVIGGIAVLYKLRIPSKQIKSEISILVKTPNQFLVDFITTPANVPTYFSWITKLEAIDERTNLTLGKTYRGILNFPFLGQHDIRYYISDLDMDGTGKWIVLKPDRIRGSYFNPEIVVMINSVTASESQFYMKIIYHRYSALFQMTLARFLKSLTDTQLEKVAHRVQVLSSAQWKRRQTNKSTRKVKSTTKSTPKLLIKDEATDSDWTNDELETKEQKAGNPMPIQSIPGVEL